MLGLQALARLWRVAHFVLSDFLNLSLQQSADTSSPLLGLNMAPAESLMLKSSSRPVGRASQGLPTQSLLSQNPKGSKGSKDRTADAERTALQAQPDAGACCKTAGWCSVHNAWHDQQTLGVTSISLAPCMHLKRYPRGDCGDSCSASAPKFEQVCCLVNPNVQQTALCSACLLLLGLQMCRHAFVLPVWRPVHEAVTLSTTTF